MLVPNQFIETMWRPANKQHYVGKGYLFTAMKDKIIVKAEDLPKGSHVKVEVVCDYCGKTVLKEYHAYLSERKDGKDCCKDCKPKRASETFREKYGVDNPFLSKEIQTKIKSTLQEKYGVEHPSQIQEVKDKIVQTNLSKYGVAYVSQNKDIKQKMRKTCMERYGVENVFQSKEIQEKIKLTFEEKYGQGNIAHTPEISEKIKQANLRKYGVEYSCQAPEVIAKMRESLYSNGNVPSSKIEKQMCQLLHDIYGIENCQDNPAVDKLNLDCLVSIEGNLIDFEYDGHYWHEGNEDKDRRRDYFLRSKGYKIVRIKGNKRDNKLPTKEQIKEAVDYLVKDNHSFIVIDMMNI